MRLPPFVAVVPTDPRLQSARAPVLPLTPNRSHTQDIAERRATLDGLPTSSPRSPQARVPRPPSPSPSHAALLAPDLTAAAAGGGRGGLRLTASHGSLSGTATRNDRGLLKHTAVENRGVMTNRPMP